MENLVIIDDKIIIGVPFEKVDVKNRTIEGYATLDNPDKVGDVIDFDASQRAFAEWPGNIREMHQKKAVGKAIGIVEKNYTDTDGTTYHGFWVKARISKGAQDTWEKILDGTLAGFSVGGHILTRKSELDKSSGKSISRITNYILSELSVVDNPCNQLSGIALVKSADGIFTIEDPIDDLQENEEDFMDELEKANLSTAGRKKEADSGAAESDGSFPINNATDLHNAISDWGRAGAKDSDKAHIVSRAKALGLTAQLPDNWNISKDYTMGSENMMCSFTESCDNCKGMLAGSNVSEDGHTERSDGSSATQALKKEAGILTENENSDISSIDISDEDKGLFKRLIEFIKGESQQVASEEEVAETEDLTKNEGGDTPEMDKETLKEALTELVAELNKSHDEKFDQVGEALSKVNEKLGSVLGADALDELKTVVEALEGRLTTIESAGAIKKSADGAGSGTEELKKSESFWGGDIVPDYFRKNLAN